MLIYSNSWSNNSATLLQNKKYYEICSRAALKYIKPSGFKAPSIKKPIKLATWTFFLIWGRLAPKIWAYNWPLLVLAKLEVSGIKSMRFNHLLRVACSTRLTQTSCLFSFAQTYKTRRQMIWCKRRVQPIKTRLNSRLVSMLLIVGWALKRC